MRITLLAAALTLMTAGMASAATPACQASPKDGEQVRTTIHALYDALAKDDDEALDRLLAPSFHAFETGKRFDKAELTGLIKESHDRGVVYEWAPGDIEVQTRCGLAWAAWENHGAVGTTAEMKPVTWLESAALHRQAGRWVIDFLHATRVPAVN
ncbi:nuclear transport factor 2 family protein [Caulobacter sp.]|uniref:nuclear transport factor 2 family protein n=1 Tax=Caulobacter sp. TaxID=78 RepID=UPI003BA85116